MKAAKSKSPTGDQQVPIPTSAADVPVAATGVLMHPEYAKAIGQLAYIWGWPMVNQINRRAAITQAPASGIWRIDDKGEIKLVRKSIDWFLVSDDNEAFYLRVYSAGDYRYHGADMGILVSRGRFQTDDRKLTQRAKDWVAAIHRQFDALPLTGSSAPVPPPADTTQKMF